MANSTGARDGTAALGLSREDWHPQASVAYNLAGDKDSKQRKERGNKRRKRKRNCAKGFARASPVFT